jgi:3-oxoacyl-[acyl-carrier-protein] synthase II
MTATSAITGAGSATPADLEAPAVAELLRGERLRSASLETRLLLAAGRLALRDAALDGDALDPDELGVVVATSHAGLHDYVELFRAGTEGDRPHVNPARGPQTGLNAPAADLSIRLRAAGPNATLANGAVGGLDALLYAADQLAAGRARAMLVCAVDALPELLRSSQPDAATVLVLERRSGRTAVRAVVAAVATAHAPDGDAADAQARAVRDALAAAGAGAGTAAVASTWTGSGEAVAQVAAAATSLARGDAAGPLLVRAGDACAAGAAVLHGCGGDA